MNYASFLEGKRIIARPHGFEIDLSSKGCLKPFQQKATEIAIRRGRCALFGDTGLGKARMGLIYGEAVASHQLKPVLLLTPCAVNQQLYQEGINIGLDPDQITLVKDQSQVRPGINITNYERLHKFDANAFGGIILDESSILKGFTSKYRKALTEFASGIDYRLALTATPSPNDLIELINHADWLGVMGGKEAIALFFTQDGNTTKNWRLKNTCIDDFWQWVASWSVVFRKPSDLGDYSDAGYDLPPLNIQNVMVDSDYQPQSLTPEFDSLPASERRTARKGSLEYRVAAAAELVNSEAGKTQQWVVWCDYNLESDALVRAIPGAIEVRGSMTLEQKEEAIAAFNQGQCRVLVSKPSITGFGLNWQFCHNTIFVGVSDSFEQQYQAIRRFWRFGQTQTVNVYLIASQAEKTVLKNVQRKEQQAQKMYQHVAKHMKIVAENNGVVPIKLPDDDDQIQSGNRWTLRLGDNVKRIKELESNSVDVSVTSIPFPGMYAYTDNPGDMGNVKDYDEFFAHLDFLIPELLRVIKPGRTLCVHLTQGLSMVSREGFMGLKDFRGDTIRAFKSHGWIHAGEVTVDQDPQLEAVRNNTHGLLFKSLSIDSSIMRMALADYVILFRKPGKNVVPISAGQSPKYNPDGGWITEEEWIEWAAPVWYRHCPSNGKLAQMQPYYPALQRQAMHQPTTNKKNNSAFNGIQDTDVINTAIARDPSDERHLCPLQFGIIERCVKLFSNPGELVLDPFNGVGSTGIKALELNRQYTGFEIKPSYFNTAIKLLRKAEQGKLARQLTIFDAVRA